MLRSAITLSANHDRCHNGSAVATADAPQLHCLCSTVQASAFATQDLNMHSRTKFAESYFGIRNCNETLRAKPQRAEVLEEIEPEIQR